MATPKKVARKVAAKSTSQSKKAGLVFPVGKIGSALRKGRYCPRVSRGASVFLAGCLEYLTSEVLEVAAKAVLQRGKSKRITPRALTLAVRHDADLGALLKDVTLSRGGVVPKVEKAIEAKKKSKATKKKSSATPKV
jgi:histone H2A